MSEMPDTMDACRAEIEALRAEVAALRRQVAIPEDTERAREGQARRILESIPLFLSVFDIVEQRTIYANRNIAELLGYSEEELVGSDLAVVIASHIHPDDQPRVAEYMVQMTAARDGEVLAIEHRVRDRSGAWRWFVNQHVVFTRGPGGEARQFLGVLEDVSRRKRAEEEIEASQNLLRAFIDHSPSIVFVKDLEGKYMMCNHELEALFGVEKGALFGKTDHDLFPAETAERNRAADRRVVETGKSIQVEEVIPHAEGTRVYFSHKFPIYDAQGALISVGCVTTDITARKRAEAAEAALQARTIEAQQQLIRQLVTPLLPLARGVVAMPLIGTIDATRAQQILETLLQGVSSHQASIAILDVTGVKVVDEQVAQALIGAAQAAKLLGAQVVLTGVQPQIARTLVELGADLRGIVMQSTLQSGIAYALRYQA